MSVSQKQLDANRENAKLGGPKTQEGKDASKYNALKHGLLAKTVVITTGPNPEDPQQFYSILAALQKRLLPQGPLENILVEKMAVSYWRSQRACREEADVFAREPQNPIINIKPDLFKNQRPSLDEDKLDCLLRYEGAIERQFYRAMHQLERLQRLRAGQMIPAPIVMDVNLSTT